MTLRKHPPSNWRCSQAGHTLVGWRSPGFELREIVGQGYRGNHPVIQKASSLDRGPPGGSHRSDFNLLIST
jgi:hypothetical protein